MIKTTKSCFITGSSSGIGHSLSNYYANIGWNVGKFDIKKNKDNEQRGGEVSECSAYNYEGDVTKAEDISAAIKNFSKMVNSPIDLIFVNAGILNAEENTLSLENCKTVMEINYYGSINTILEGVKYLAKNGKIVITSSISSEITTFESGAYSASKSAINKWAEAFRLKNEGISIQTVILGFVNTPMTKGIHHSKFLEITSDEAARKIAAAAERSCITVNIPKIRNKIILSLSILPHGIKKRILKSSKALIARISKENK